jgi:methylated-DNA-[protein]-cysteine S-methyltransferase
MQLHERPWQAQTVILTPLGPMRLAATALGLGGAWFEGQKHHPQPLAAPDDAEHPMLQAAALALAEYWREPQASTFDLDLDLGGSPFQQAVWAALRAIPPGRSVSYGALARSLGRPEAARAVGAAVGRNPISVIVPCHRVLGGSGRLTGYAGGLARKQALLRGEGLAV